MMPQFAQAINYPSHKYQIIQVSYIFSTNKLMEALGFEKKLLCKN